MAFSQDPISTNANPQALQSCFAELYTFEQSSNEALGARSDHDATSIGEGDETQSDRHGFANERLLSGGSTCFTDDNETCRNADAGLQGIAEAFGLEIAERLDHSEASLHRALGIILAGLRISEKYEDSITRIVGNKPAMSLDNFSDG